MPNTNSSFFAARPENPAPIAEADIYAAIREFILAYALPALHPDNVYFDKSTADSAGTDDYALISIISATQRGTPLESFSVPAPENPAAPGILRIETLMDVAVQVKFYANNDNARLRAQRVGAVLRSATGAQFFADRGLSGLYADAVRQCPVEDSASQPARCYETILHVPVWSGDSVEVQYFDTVRLEHLEDIDAHHRG